LLDERDGTGKDGALVLLGARDLLGELIDALIDGLAATALDWKFLLALPAAGDT
jgi:hypothetical protein